MSKFKFYKGLCKAPSGARMYRVDGFREWPPRLFPAPVELPYKQVNPWNPERGGQDSVFNVGDQALAIVKARLQEQLGPEAVFEVVYGWTPETQGSKAIMQIYVADKLDAVMLKLGAELLYPEGA